jgi:pyruvate dehydrogenase E2 component (dihydrolipoamide acetyltransferase)
MAISVVMPALEMAQETGKLVSWLKEDGDTVAKGEPLLEVETDKATVEIEATTDGILAGVKARQGDVVPVGTVIAWILQPGESLPSEASNAMTAAPSTRSSAANSQIVVEAVKEKPAVLDGGESIRLSPKARRMAKELGVDVSSIRGTGPEGSITTEDVVAAKNGAESKPAASEVSSRTLSTIGRIVAERTAESWTTVPHFFVIREADAAALLAFHKAAKTTIEKLSVTDCLIGLVARTLERHSLLNSTYQSGSIQTLLDINISLAIAVPGGVIAPVIHQANAASLSDIAERRGIVVERARAGRTLPSDLAGGTFTVSNLGMYKVDAFTAIITPPQAAILAVGAVSDRVVARDGAPVVRPMVTLTLSSDHRVASGATAATFLNDLVEAMREPEKWLRV